MELEQYSVTMFNSRNIRLRKRRCSKSMSDEGISYNRDKIRLIEESTVWGLGYQEMEIFY